MEDHRDNGNVIEIIRGDVSTDNHVISQTGHELIGDGTQPPKLGNEPPIGKMYFNAQSSRPSTYMVQNQRSSIDRYCRTFNTEMGCIYGDQCAFIHDDQSRPRERHVITITPGSSFGFGNGGAVRYGGASGNGGANGNGGQPPANEQPVRSASWRTKICNKWESAGFCPFGYKCMFAHGEAELQRYGGGPVVKEAIPIKQGPVLPNKVAAASSSVVRAGGSGQLPEPEKKRWKGPNKISRIYGDWIEDL